MEPGLDFFKGKKILITGGGGYLGSKLAENLVQYEADVCLTDVVFNKISRKLIENQDNVKQYPADITRKSEIEKVCKEVKPSYVFHFCALLNRERDFNHYNKLYEVNVQGTLNLLESLCTVEYTGLCYSGSSEVYGAKNPVPFHENQLPDPASPYSLTKLMAENLIRTYSEIHNKPFTIFRIFNFFGPDMPESFFINQLTATLKRNEYFEMTGGEQVRDFLHVDDLLTAIIEIVKSGKNNAETINICSGKGVLLKDLAVKIAKKLNKEHLLKIGAIPYRENEIWKMVGMNKKLFELIPDLKKELTTIDGDALLF